MYPDWWGKKDYAVLKAVQAFGPVRGRRALHKILYFANLKTHTFKYQWYTYGPYSPELAYKIADHVYGRSLDVEKGGGGGRARYDMSLSAGGGRLLENARYKEIDSALDWAHALLGGGMPPREMELLASVHYIASCGHGPGRVHGAMLDLKPAAGFTAGYVERAMRFLERKGLLGPGTAAGGAPQDPTWIHA